MSVISPFFSGSVIEEKRLRRDSLGESSLARAGAVALYEPLKKLSRDQSDEVRVALAEVRCFLLEKSAFPSASARLLK